jgi:alkanesulfonate monooxygenase SsuD/methylene tetrahydromethanopterin reductase-like flavin-dependent oxidoreductase (luciferase family)
MATAERRFGAWGGGIAGTAPEVADRLAAEIVDHDVEGFVLQFSDFGTPETVARFMDEVAPVVRSASRH